MYGDPMGVIGGRLYEVWEVYGDPMGVIRGRLYEVCEVFLGDSGPYLLLMKVGPHFPEGP